MKKFNKTNLCFFLCLLVSLLSTGCTTSDSGEKERSKSIDTTPTNTATEELTPKASVTVSSQVINTVNPEIFGDNTSYRGEGYGLWDEETNSPDAELLDKLKNTGITHLRYPGGIEGDYYHWYEIIGNNRVAQIDPFSDEYPTYDVSTGTPYDVVFGSFVKK